MGIVQTVSGLNLHDIYTTKAALNAVEGRFSLSTAYTAEAWEKAQTLLAALGQTAFAVDGSNLNTTSDLAAPNLGEAPSVTHPGAYESGIEEVAFPDLAALRESLALEPIILEGITLPILEAIAPSVTLPAAPTDPIPEVPDGVPSVSDPDMPATPDLTLPEPPAIADIALPAPPELNLPGFEGSMPTADLTPPEPMFAYTEETYESNVADALRTKLYQDLTLGGTGLSPAVEEAIWANYLMRQAVENEAKRTERLNRWAGSGFEFPPGALDDALDELELELGRVNNLASRDIAIEQAKLAQQNTQFAITSGLVHEQQLMGYANQVAQRAFERAKALVEMAVTIYQAKVTAFTAQLEAYKTQAAVYETRIRAELARVELYKGQLEGAKITAEIQNLRVSQYLARLEAVKTVIALYSAQLEGAKLKIEVDRTRIQAFAEQINAAKARIDGVTAKYNLYQAQLAGEVTKVEIYGKQVDAYKTQVEAKKVEADLDLAQVQAAIEANKEKVEILKAAIDKYSAEVSAQSEEEKARATAYGAQVDAYKADVSARDGHIAQLVENYKAQVSQWSVQIEAAIKEVEVNLRTQTALKEIQAEAIKAASNISAQMVAAALSSVSASAQMGYSEGINNAYHGSESLGNSLTESHTYTHTE